jgi:hypothetical protein
MPNLLVHANPHNDRVVVQFHGIIRIHNMCRIITDVANRGKYHNAKVA